MNAPTVSVLMPVYNAQRFLKRAIESVLSQTFTDFEFLIINDGSTDTSVTIIESFQDPRIRLVHNEKNSGVIDTLNKGISLAKGKYIARMDADDICLPERFEKQVHYLDHHSEIAVVAARVMQITANEAEIGYWDIDLKAITSEQIYRMCAKTNCIAHPTVMMRSEIAQAYRYNKKQKGSEDWDLWMRMLSDGHKIDKLPECLLKYRIHNASVTVMHNRTITLEKKINRVRFTFLKERIAKLHLKKFELLVLQAIFRTIARDIKINRLPRWLRFWKRMLTLSPFRSYAEFRLLKKTVLHQTNTQGIFFFFPYTHVGGAEKVHALITETVKDQRPWIFFTGFSLNRKFLPLFQNNGLILDVARGINHPFFIKRSMKLVVQAIEQAAQPVVFGCNNLFFYDLIPNLSSKVKVIDLMHDFRFEGEETVFKSYVPLFMRCDHRIFISERAIDQTKKFYAANSVDTLYYDRLKYIANYTTIPPFHINKSATSPLSILYVGRGTAEKRAYLVSEIAKVCFEKKLPVQFTVVGDIEQPLELKNNPAIVFTGELTDNEKIKDLYSKADVLLITSEREGFPMAIMEGMAYGVIPVSTPVGDVPKHIKNGETGYLTSSIQPEEAIKEIVHFISVLIAEKNKRAELSKHVFDYAKTNFSKEKFTQAYRHLLIKSD